jgi:hypothetical protein
MKSLRNILGIVAVIFVMASCQVAGPLAVSSNPVGSKVGTSSYGMILAFPPLNGDASIRTAAKNGGITKIATVDYKVSWYVFFTKVETIVTGE